MDKVLKITVNMAIFFVVIGFAWYMAISINKDHSPSYGSFGESAEPFVSLYTQVAFFELPKEINRFDLNDDKLFISTGQAVYIFDTEGKRLSSFLVASDVRDITVGGEEIYLLYPTRIAVYSMTGNLLRQWKACSELSDYCSFTLAGNAVFVTDAENKNICKYTTDGDLVKFIQSPAGFIIPSYSFDIDSWNDTICCVNSGRHLVEMYTLNGDFISAFGGAGSEAGFFAGCCNPSYISFTPDGWLITSEKGNPRICCFERNGKFKELWLNNKMLGGGNHARQVKVREDRLFVAEKNKILIYM